MRNSSLLLVALFCMHLIHCTHAPTQRDERPADAGPADAGLPVTDDAREQTMDAPSPADNRARETDGKEPFPDTNTTDKTPDAGEPDTTPDTGVLDGPEADTGASDATSTETAPEPVPSDSTIIDGGSEPTPDADSRPDAVPSDDVVEADPREATADAPPGDVVVETPPKEAIAETAPGETTADAPATPACLPAGYAAYFVAHPQVFAATLGRLNATAQAYFCKDLQELETQGRITIAEPAASANCTEPQSCTYITPTTDERAQILAAKYAHGVWLDRHKKVPWSLSQYSSSDLDGLFNPQVIFRNGTHFMSVVDHAPSEAWAYLTGRKLVKADQKSSMAAVLDDLRTTDTQTEFVHGIGTGTNPDPVNTAYTLDEALRTRVTKSVGVTVRVSRRGCHSMSRILLALFRAMNIPGQEVHNGRWYGNGHSTPTWPALGLVLPHGDDVYQATLRTTPSSALLAPMRFYTDSTHTAVCGNNPACLGRRYADLNGITYPAKYMMERCCTPTKYNYTSCLDYLTKNYATTLTSAEITAAVTSIQAKCPP